MPKAPLPSQDAAIRQLILQFEQATQSADSESLEKLLTADADHRIASGAMRRGRDEVIAGWLRSAAVFKGAKTQYTVESIRFVTPTVALVETASAYATRSSWRGGDGRLRVSTFPMWESQKRSAQHKRSTCL